MSELVEERFLIKSNSYMVDLTNVDFITFKENERDAGTYWVKLHIGSKEARYICEDKDSLRTLLENWSKLRGKEITITDEDIIEW